jgi:preprotein translocase subunit SecB
MEEKNIRAAFQFVDSYIRNSSFKIHNRNLENSKMDLGIEVSISNLKENKEELSAELRLKNSVDVIDDNGNRLVEIEVEMAGIFRAHNMDKDKFMEFMKFSGTPIVYQSIRSYIMNISALGGIETIRTPLINYVEFFKGAEQIKQEN